MQFHQLEKAVELAEKGMEKISVTDQPTGEKCDLCGHDMVLKFGRFGKFIACSGYPQCRNVKPYLEKVGARCPECGGDLVKRRTRKGRFFYGCANYPTCSFSTWKEPVPTPCPKCGGLLVVASKEYAKCVKCEEQVEMSALEQEKVEA